MIGSRLLPLLVAFPLSALAQGAPPAPAQAAPARRVLTLDEAVRAARARQPQLRQAQAATGAAEARSDQARAPLLPQVAGTASYERATSNVARPATGTTVVSRSTSWRSSDFFSAGASVSQVLFDLGLVERWRAAGASADAQRATQRAAELDVVAGAQSAFFVARAARDLVGVARETLANQEAHLRQVAAFVEVGTRPAIDLAQARADRASAEVQRVRAENAYQNARSLLAQAMGEPGAPDFDVSDDALPPVPGEDGPLDPLVTEAAEARPELVSLADQRRAQQLSRDAARAGWLPTVGAQAGLSDAGPSLDATVWNWSASVTLGWSLFEGGLTRARVREADANLEGLAAQEDALRIQVRVDVDSARQGVQAALSARGAAEEALANARERLRLAEGRYQAGAGSIIELGDAQVAATSAGAQRVQADYDLAAARAKLLRALGR
jgi:outer membrane protein